MLSESQIAIHNRGYYCTQQLIKDLGYFERTPRTFMMVTGKRQNKRETIIEINKLGQRSIGRLDYLLERSLDMNKKTKVA